VESNISHVNADDVWALGYDGSGMVVANLDTGVRYTHETLQPSYRGNLGGSFDHDHNWLDGVDGSASSPVDDHGHGSHTMGTMIGDDGGANQIGMAPGATWVACDSCDGTGCPSSALLTCAQWIIAPYPVGNPSAPDPSTRPHVVNNSWADCDTSYDSWFQGSVDSWHAAGIYPVFANGNAGNCGYGFPPGCYTVGNPARYGNVTGVGSTGQSNGAYAVHSNWGPTDNPDPVNPNGYPTVKPNVVAPGVDIRSSLNFFDSHYGSWEGTSMSAPHVAGLVALMWQAGPCLVGDYATTEDIIQSTATAIPYASSCGGEGPGNLPNMATGWGEIDALAAVNEAISVCGGIFSDGFEAGNPSRWDFSTP
jgi:subtilisin family serine protease